MFNLILLLYFYLLSTYCYFIIFLPNYLAKKKQDQESTKKLKVISQAKHQTQRYLLPFDNTSCHVPA